MASPLQASIHAWGEKTFGKEVNSDQEGRLRKLWEEMEELVREFGRCQSVTPAGQATMIISPELKDELGDVYLCLLALGAALGVDIEKAGAAKMAKLGSRVYEYYEGKGWVKVGG
jgi:NTP pyrophosphatase (non-canonical NTP hydrolase)